MFSFNIFPFLGPSKKLESRNSIPVYLDQSMSSA